jgi:hypothetical protein
MSMRWKKLIGLFALLAILFVYSLLVMSLAVRILPTAGQIATFFFYAIAGTAWVIPVKPLIVWMNTPGRSDAAGS